MFHLEELRTLVKKYNQVMQRYFVQYLSGYDAAVLNQLIQVTDGVVCGGAGSGYSTVRAGSGNPITMACPGDSQLARMIPHGTAPGGGVWEYLSPDEPHFGTSGTSGSVAVSDKCMGDLKGRAGGGKERHGKG